MVAGDVALGQGGAGDRAGIVVEADESIELGLGGGRLANRGGDFGGMGGEILGKARIALGLRPARPPVKRSRPVAPQPMVQGAPPVPGSG